MWFAIQTLPQSELKAVNSISRMGVIAVSPVVIERRIRRQVKHQYERPMFQGYIFIEAAALPDWLYEERHILRVLPSWRAPKPIPDELIGNALSHSGEITVDEWKDIQKFYRGEMVRHKKSGLIGKVDEVRGRKLVMLVELLGKMHTKIVRQDQVEAA